MKPASHIDRAFAKMPKMMRVPQVNNFINSTSNFQSTGGFPQQGQFEQQSAQDTNYQQSTIPQQSFGNQWYEPWQKPAKFLPQQNSITSPLLSPNSGTQPQQPQYSQNQPPDPSMSKDQTKLIAEQYLKYYIDYWNNYQEQLQQYQDDQEEDDDDVEDSQMSLNDRVSITDQILNKDNEDKPKNIQLSQVKPEQGVLQIDKLKSAFEDQMKGDDSQLSVNSNLIRDEFKIKEFEDEVDEDDQIPVDQDFIFEQSILEEEVDEFIPECKRDPARNVLDFIEEEKRQEAEKQEKMRQEIEQKEKEEKQRLIEEEKQRKEHDQFFEENPDLYLEHRKKQKKAIFTTLKYEIDRLLKQTQNVEEDLFEAQNGVDKLRKDTDAHNLKTKKLEFYLRAKRIQRDIDDAILHNKEEDMIQANAELIKGVQENIVDEQLETMYQKNQELFLEVTKALQEVVGTKNPQTFKNYEYYETLKENAKFNLQKEKAKRKEVFDRILPPQKNISKNILSLPKNRQSSKDKQNKPLHTKTWGQHQLNERQFSQSGK